MDYRELLPKRNRDEPVNEQWRMRVLNDRSLRCPPPCGALMPQRCPEPVDVPFDKLPRSGLFSAPLVSVLHRKIFEVIEPHLIGHVAGKCTFVDGRVIEEFVTLYALPGKGVSWGGVKPESSRQTPCTACGTQYATVWEGQSGVRAASLMGRRAALSGRSGSLVADIELAERIYTLGLPNVDRRSVKIIP